MSADAPLVSMKKQARAACVEARSVKRPRVDDSTVWLLTPLPDEDGKFLRSALDSEALCKRQLRETGSRVPFNPGFWVPCLHDDDTEFAGTVVTSTPFSERDEPILFDAFGFVHADQAVTKLLETRPEGYSYYAGFGPGNEFRIDSSTLFVSKDLALRMKPVTLRMLTTSGFGFWKDVCLF